MRVIVVGCGRLGASVATTLAKQGNDVVIVDKDRTAFRKLDENFPGQMRKGDATDDEFLRDVCDINNVQKIIIVTDNDNVNLYVSHLAFFIFKTPHIFVRLNDVDKGKLLKDTNITPLYPFELSLNALLGGK